MCFWCHIDILFVEKKKTNKKRTRAKRAFIDVSEGHI